MKIFIYTIIAIVTASIIAGFFIVGSPQDQRLRRFDEQRVQDLQMIQNQIVTYWQNKGKLPTVLTDLEDSIRGIQIPKDPQTGMSYEYNIKGLTMFNLCAEFARPDSTQSNPKGTPIPYPITNGPGNWSHGAGKTCFERTIDKDIYKPNALIPNPVPLTIPPTKVQ